ncbi:MAG: hypothetical protein QY325_01445 [Flavobacteriales bacterium]|nr:MAG: hypothetical protein QY325_01445 [Flavobacteriales bacterium]
MTDQELARALRALSRNALMLQTELRNGLVDEGLIADIEACMEQGISLDARCAALVGLVDALRESTLTPRAELLSDTIRACEKLRDGIERVLGRL